MYPLFLLILIQINIASMLVDHRHIMESIKKEKRAVTVNKDNALLVITSKRLSFLTKTILSVLQYHCYAFEVMDEGRNTLMGYTLPVIVFEDVILQKQSVVQFLVDICMGHLDIQQYMERRTNTMQLYRAWACILNTEADTEAEVTISQYKSAEKDEHTNKVFEQHINMSVQVVNRGYQKIFNNYQPNNFNLEAVFSMHVINSILQEVPRMPSDYVLRAYFQKSIDFAQQYAAIIQNKEIGSVDKTILMDAKAEEPSQYSNFYLNYKWFTGFFTVLTGIFLKWGK